MVNRGDRHPPVAVVAVFANIRRLYVRRAFASSIYAVVAVDAIVRNIDVIEVRRSPRERRMTVIAIVAARDMRGVLSGSDNAVVAGATTAEYLRMVDRKGRHPGRRIMAIFANVGSEDVCRVLARRVGAVVAA